VVCDILSIRSCMRTRFDPKRTSLARLVLKFGSPVPVIYRFRVMANDGGPPEIQRGSGAVRMKRETPARGTSRGFLGWRSDGMERPGKMADSRCRDNWSSRNKGSARAGKTTGGFGDSLVVGEYEYRDSASSFPR
jgi:hypothetical protein